MKYRAEAVSAILVIATLYYFVSMFAYNWRHPELSQMQMMQSIPEALSWEK